MHDIEIFEAEASIQDKIKDNFITIASVVKKSNRSVEEIAKAVESKTSTANPNQADLFYFDSILVSTGWNKNDDVFSADELWKARATPVDKQVNFMHDEKVIIGHMTDAFILNQDGDIISPEKFEDLPEKFDIGVSSVIYTAWSDADFKECINSLIDELSQGNWYVSMEARFPAFDYAVKTPDGENKVIARNKETAFLSKHLAAYGGTGEYEGYKIGRLLKNIYFSGKGVVNKPANERSIVLSTSKQFKSSATLTNFQEVNRMDELEQTKKDLESTKAQLATATTKLADVETYKTKAEELAQKLEASEKLVSEHKSAVAELTEKLQKTEAEKADMQKKVDDMEKAKCKASRVTQLVSAGLDSTKAEEVFAKFENSTDDQFSEVVSLYASMKKSKAENQDKDAVDQTDNTTAMEKAEVEKSVAGSVDETPKTEEVAKAAVKWISGQIARNTTKSTTKE